MIYTVTLNPALDYVMTLDSLEGEDVLRAKSAAYLAGGKGTNVSTVLRRLGVPSVSLGFVAGFTGDKFLHLLSEEGLNHDFIRLPKGETRINVKLKAGRELDVNAEGPEVTEEELDKLLSKLDTAEKGDIIVLAGSVPRSLPADTYARIMARLSGRGLRFVVDATGGSLLSALEYRPFLVKPNLYELSSLFGAEIKTDAEVEKYARRLKDAGAENVLVSLGKDGALLADGEGAVSRVGIVPGKAVSTSGCGDSMVAGFIAGYLESGGYTDALLLGSAAGVATAHSEGLATAAEIYDALSKLRTI